MTIKPEPEVIYLVGELKQAFADVRAVRLRDMQQEPLPKNSRCLVDHSPCQQLAIEATKSLELLKLFADQSYIGLQEVPCELAGSAHPNAQPFHKAYVSDKYEILTGERLEQFSTRIRSLD